jgi:hypothetical protein
MTMAGFGDVMSARCHPGIDTHGGRPGPGRPSHSRDWCRNPPPYPVHAAAQDIRTRR